MSELLQQIRERYRHRALSCEAEQQRSLNQFNAESHLLEKQGWRKWLKTVGSRTFTGDFGFFHTEFWDWYWRVTEKRKQNLPLNDEELAFLAIWGRGCGKSSVVEWAAIAEGALVGEGFVLYVCANQANAERHVESIRDRIESDAVSHYYPQLSAPKMGKHGNRFGWRQDFLATESGWAILPVGLDVAVRGIRFGDLRPTLIIFDDIDEADDSPAVVEKKIDTIARKILPAGTKNTVKLFAQNLIHENSVANLIYTRKTDMLSRRIVSGAYPTFESIQIEQQTDQATGDLRNVIVAGKPTWEYVDLESCQRYLDDSGLEGFLSEYQHDFTHDQQDRVIPEYDEQLHVITWSQFEAVFGSRKIPRHWSCGLGLDIGYTKGHISAWTWLARSAQNSNLPGKWFRYRGMTFTGESIDDQALAVIAAMRHTDQSDRRGNYSEVEQISLWRMSHEKLGERMTLRNKYQLPFQQCKSGKEDGLAQWRHWLRVDKKMPHPFRDDTLLPDGTYLYGCPTWFDVVADEQLKVTRDDAGLATHRRQTYSWKRRKAVLTNSGLQDDQPVKADEDSCDSTRMLTAEPDILITPLTRFEQIEANVPARFRLEEIERRADTQTEEQTSRDIQTNRFHTSLREMLEKRNKPDEGGGHFTL